MSQPHICPLCNGSGELQVQATIATAMPTRTCNACDGKGIVWEPTAIRAWPQRYDDAEYVESYTTGGTVGLRAWVSSCSLPPCVLPQETETTARRAPGPFDFWDDTAEDIYTLEDGEPC